MTIEAWIEIDSFQAPVKGIVCKASGTAMPTPDSEYALVLFNTTPAFEVYNGNYLVRAFADQKTPNTNTWYHVVGTWNGTHYAIYVNGVLCDSGTNSPSSPYSYPIDLQIGRIGTYSWTYFNGTIDEVKIYNYAKPVKLGDVNDDGTVNIMDGVIIGVAFGSRPGDPEWNPIADIAPVGALDNFINIQDVVLWAIHFGEDC
jgi:hypothetical protein